jgi:membrane-associated phospholipid phosphatase/tRNA A-37 threonylcarbamoyl transferase component Bud32
MAIAGHEAGTDRNRALRDVRAPGRLRSGPAGRRRRPSGEPPPLPRKLHRTGRYWTVLGVAVALFWFVAALTGGAINAPFERLDRAILEAAAELRSPALTRVMRTVHALGSEWTLRVLAWSALLVPLLFRRVRHTLVFLGSYMLVKAIGATLATVVARPRPLGVPIIGSWEGFAHPSQPVADLSVALLGLAYTLVPQGRWRQTAKWVGALLVAALGASRVYLGVDHPSDVISSMIVGVSVPLLAFRLLTPNDVFPVVYRRGRSAHLDVGGARGEAIKRALEQQLGLCVLEVAPFGLSGSAGSTPLRIRVDGDPETFLFAKLYAANHLRADRWYKLGRTLRYGRLEDEASFSTVRRLVQYEDYLLRVMKDGGLPTAEPYGFVEITPEREYLLVTEFFAGAKELGEVEADDALIDDALRAVRNMWDAGVAHRDIKPSNVLVHDGRIVLIDVAFGEVRPSPWRQAVDLANMMLTLGLRADPERVYERALRFFTPDEIAEAFAATRGVTSPTQLRGLIRACGLDLVEEFRRLAPPRPPIPIQRWTFRRIGLGLAVALAALAATLLVVNSLQSVRLL